MGKEVRKVWLFDRRVTMTKKMTIVILMLLLCIGITKALSIATNDISGVYIQEDAKQQQQQQGGQVVVLSISSSLDSLEDKRELRQLNPLSSAIDEYLDTIGNGKGEDDELIFEMMNVELEKKKKKNRKNSMWIWVSLQLGGLMVIIVVGVIATWVPCMKPRSVRDRIIYLIVVVVGVILGLTGVIKLL